MGKRLKFIYTYCIAIMQTFFAESRRPFRVWASKSWNIRQIKCSHKWIDITLYNALLSLTVKKFGQPHKHKFWGYEYKNLSYNKNRKKIFRPLISIFRPPIFDKPWNPSLHSLHTNHQYLFATRNSVGSMTLPWRLLHIACTLICSNQLWCLNKSFRNLLGTIQRRDWMALYRRSTVL